MTSTYRPYFILTPLMLALVVSCAEEPDFVDDEFEFAQPAGLTKGNGGTNGVDPDFCDDPANPCVLGEGDCDFDQQCEGELVCGLDNGPNFGMGAPYDVCVPAHCMNGMQDGDETGVDQGGSCGSNASTCEGLPSSFHPDACNLSCPCSSGEGDCDSNADCVAGTVCTFDVGEKFGVIRAYDICLPPHCSNGVQDGNETEVDCGGSCGTICGVTCDSLPNGHENRCSTDCPCASGFGDCDSNLECASGLTCIARAGATLGLGAGVDVCLPSHCANGMFDGDETALDCGGSCAPCAPVGNVVSLGGANDDQLRDVTIDSAGNIIVVGIFDTATEISGATLNGQKMEIFVAKFSPTLQLLWTRTFGGANSDGLLNVAVEIGPNDEIALGGDFNGTVDFGNGPVTVTPSSPISTDAFLLVLEPNGTNRWSTTFNGVGMETVAAVDFDTSGNVFATGDFGGTVNFAGQNLTSAGALDVFVIKVRGDNGQAIATTSFGGTETDRGRALEVQGASVYVGGSFRGTATFGSNSATSNGVNDAYVIRLFASNLNYISGKFFGGSSLDEVNALSTDSNLLVTVGGNFGSQVDFGNGTTYTSRGLTDAFVLQTAGDLSFRWVDVFGGPRNDIVYDIDHDGSTGRIFATGVMEGDVEDFREAVSTGFGGPDSFLISYDGHGTIRSSQRDGGPSTDRGRGIGARNGRFVYGGTFFQTATVSSSSITSTGSRDMFVTVGDI